MKLFYLFISINFIVLCRADLKDELLLKQDVNFLSEIYYEIVTSVEKKLVLTTVGKNYAIKKGLFLTIYRDYQYIATAMIIDIFPDGGCAAKITEQREVVKKYDKILFGKRNEKYIKIFVLRQLHVDISIIKNLSYDSSLEVRATVAYNGETPAKILKRLYSENKPLINKYLTLNSNTPSYILNEIFSSNKNKICQLMMLALSLNKSISENTLLSLFKNKETSKEVKLCAIRNSNVSIKSLIQLSRNQKKIIRLAVARHEKCSYDLLIILMKDKAPEVRKEVALHKNTNEEMLKVLIRDKDRLVRMSALSCLNKK